MRIKKYLVINSKGSAKISNRGKPTVKGDEVMMEINFVIPDAIFSKPSLTAEIEIPADAVSRPVIAADVADNIKRSLAQISGYDVKIKIEGIE